MLGFKIKGYFYPVCPAGSLVETAISGKGKLVTLIAGWYNACSLLGTLDEDNGDALCLGHNNQATKTQ
jgi:hypothetical protein